MARRYLNRYKSEEFDQDYDEEEDIVSTKLERIGGDEGEIDPFDVQLRRFSVEKNLNDIKEKDETLKEEIKNAGHQTRNANQYQKFINAHLEDRVSRINRLKEEKNKFDDELKLLTGERSVPETQPRIQQKANQPNMSSGKLGIHALQEVLNALTANKNAAIAKLTELNNQIKETETQLSQLDLNIEKTAEELKRKQEKEEKIQNNVNDIKDELSELKDKYNVEELQRALDSLIKSKSQS